MSERTKRILAIIVFLLVVFGFGFALYWIFFRSQEEPPTSEPTVPSPVGSFPRSGTSTGPGGGVVTGPGGGLTPSPSAPGTDLTLPSPPGTGSRTSVLYDQPTRALSLSPAGGVRTYNPLDGKFYRVNANGEAVPMSDETFYSVENVNWGKQTDKAILEYPDGSKIYYDFALDKPVTLPRHWEDFDFSPQDNSIVAKSIGSNESNRFLIMSNPDGTEARPIEELGDNADKVLVSWSPNNQMVAFSFTGEPLGYDRQSILLIGQYQENFKGLVVEGRGFIPQWSPSGENLLYSVYNAGNGYRPTLWISGAAGDNVNANRQQIGIETWADKCAWQNETSLVCAVPVDLPEGAGLQRPLANEIPDALYKIDLKTGTKINLGVPDGNPTIEQIVVSPDGKSAFYTDRNSGKIMKFSL